MNKSAEPWMIYSSPPHDALFESIKRIPLGSEEIFVSAVRAESWKTTLEQTKCVDDLKSLAGLG